MSTLVIRVLFYLLKLQKLRQDNRINRERILYINFKFNNFIKVHDVQKRDNQKITAVPIQYESIANAVGTAHTLHFSMAE